MKDIKLLKVLTIAFLGNLFVFDNPAGAQGLTFTSTTYSVGHGPGCVVAADVNGDNKLDLICANYIDNTLTVLTNSGNGVFGSNATINVGKGPACVVAADVNGDGKLDLICANFGGGGGKTLTVLTNNGSGLFGSNATLTVGGGPCCVVAADVNGDGKLDLITANGGTNGNGTTLTILTNNGSGVFGSNATLTVGSEPVSVVATDVNGDGKLDLVCANGLGESLTVLTNNGSGYFGFNATIPLGTEPSCVTAVDVNGDGKTDLICADIILNALVVFTNNGSGGFAASTQQLSLPKFGGEYLALPESVAAADLNGDGRMDLVSANSDDGVAGTLSVFTNNASFRFGSNTTLNVGAFANWVVAADLNADGKPDLISANQDANTLTVLLNTSSFPPSTSTPAVNLVLQSNVVHVSWPSVSPGWSLQENSDLTKTNWLPSGCGGWPINDNGTNKSLTLPFPKGKLFYRLLHS
jgi:hypothetical protein